jgi:phosphatidylglycerophosphate synthase
MRKIPVEYENPIDNIMYDLSEIVSPTFHSFGFTPNMVTTLSNISAIIVIILLLEAKYVWSAIFLMIAFFFDCLDGHLARKYKQFSKFGDYYDHASDVIKTVLLLYVLYLKLKPKYNKNKGIIIFIIIIFIILNILTFAHFGCQEQILKENKNQFESDTLKITENFIFTDCYEQLKISKYFSCGTNILFLVIVILFIGTL